MKKIMMIGACALALTGCVSQEQADAKMGKGCEAALMAQIGGDNVKDITQAGATADVRVEGTYRRINMTYVESQAFDQTPKNAECLFAESWGPGKSSHTAILEQLKANGTIYGKDGGVMQGALEDFLKLTEAAAKAMGQ